MKQEYSFPGSELRARREELGWTHEDVFQRVHIAPVYVEALEENNLDAIPAGAYAVGFLKSYCRLLDLDADRYVNSYHAARRPSQRFLNISPKTTTASAPAWVSEVVLWAAVCTAVAFGWLTYMVVVNPKAQDTDNRVEATTFEMKLPPTPAQPDL